MKAKAVRLLLLVAILATVVWSSPATSYAATCPAAHCDFFVSECLSSGGSSFSYNILGTCTFGLDSHTLFQFVCRYNNGQGTWSEMCWDD